MIVSEKRVLTQYKVQEKITESTFLLFSQQVSFTPQNVTLKKFKSV